MTNSLLIDKKELLTYKLSKWAIVVVVTLIYLSLFSWNFLFGIIMAVLFAYCFHSVADRIVNLSFFASAKPLLLKSEKKIIKEGIPQDITIAFFRPIFAKTTREMDNLLSSMKKDIVNNLEEEKKNLKFIVIDNTRDLDVRTYTEKEIVKLQDEFGRDSVFYFHRDHKCDFFKKVGIYHDSLLLLYEGWARPRLYTDKRWEQWTKGTRCSDNRIFDCILGDTKALGIKNPVEDILDGKDVEIEQGKRIKISIISDADNVWPKGEVKKLVAKMLHSENKKFTMYQPSIEISNPKENLYIKIISAQKEMGRFDPIAKWRIYKFSPFYGKGAMNLEKYLKDVVKSEKLHPGKAASHDFQESLWTNTCLLEDVYILEKSFSNKLSELTRWAQWLWGDLETVRQFLFRKFNPGRRAHLYTLLRGLIGQAAFNLWLLGTLLGWEIVGLSRMRNPHGLFLLFAGIVVLDIGIPNFLSPFVNRMVGKPYQGKKVISTDKSTPIIILEGVSTTIVFVLIHLQDLIYKPIAFVKNYISQLRQRPYVWKTQAMGEM